MARRNLARMKFWWILFARPILNHPQFDRNFLGKDNYFRQVRWGGGRWRKRFDLPASKYFANRGRTLSGTINIQNQKPSHTFFSNNNLVERKCEGSSWWKTFGPRKKFKINLDRGRKVSRNLATKPHRNKSFIHQTGDTNCYIPK